ncbi:MAPEG family protein [Roseovarius aestuariivivens]|uniref:MAPEG family protein n=1 Tax=Roseovarius aestuariivivens TaxID=1888910 RepID=UPI001081F12B|nr:MAPEG family protein [Roseovarius aestuariivivens]
MTPELTALTLAALLQVLQLCLYAVAGNLALGTRAALSPRDGQMPDLPEKPGRIKRALDNHFEGLLLFAIACLVLTVSGTATAYTATCAYIYLVARVLYIPAYVFGWVPWRSVIWATGFFATVAMLGAALV